MMIQRMVRFQTFRAIVISPFAVRARRDLSKGRSVMVFPTGKLIRK